eukprot:2478638-Amphidinium_carterae.1
MITTPCQSAFKSATGIYNVVPVWWKPGKPVHDDKPLSLAVSTRHQVLGGLGGVVDLEEEEGGEPAHLGREQRSATTADRSSVAPPSVQSEAGEDKLIGPDWYSFSFQGQQGLFGVPT